MEHNMQPAPKKKKMAEGMTAKPPGTRAGGAEIAALKKQVARINRGIALLRSEMGRVLSRLRKMQQQLRGKASRAYVHTAARKLINKAFAGTKRDATRFPVSQSAGGVKLLNINVGRDLAKGETVGSKGIPIVIRAKGMKWARSVRLYVYALPVKDMMMRTQYLIHFDGEVPCLDGLMQTHLRWRGHRFKGERMAGGKYKVLVRVVFYGYNKAWKRVGHALRYWGDAKPTTYNLRIR